MEQPQRIRLRLPEQDLSHLTLGSTNLKKMQEWVDALPMANVGESSRLLYQLIQELNRLRSDGRTRFALLEVLRPALLNVERQLGKHYLGQSVVLPEKQRKVASLAQALQVHLSVGYKLVAIDTVRRTRDKDAARAAVVSIHRALTSMAEILLRGYQLYLPTPRFHWLEMHQLFLLAESNNIADIEVEDKSLKRVKSSTVRDTYARALLLSTARPNQLRQQEIEMAWDATEEWCGLVSINDTKDNSDIFAFDLQLDTPPTYRKLAAKHQEGETLRSIDARDLSSRLKFASDTGQLPTQHDELAFPRGFNRELALHLSQAWGNLTERAFQRLAAHGTLEICVGLGAMHYFISGGADFDIAVRGGAALLENRDNRFLRGRGSVEGDDAWSQAFDGGNFRMADGMDFSQLNSTQLAQMRDQERQRYDSYQCSIINNSPGGYCLEWAGDMPSHIRTGELLGLRGPDDSGWSIGVIRWIKQLSGKGAQLGIELLAPKATPCGARVLKETGETTEWMRTLLLPELRAIGQEATLIAPAIAFNTGYKVMINQDGQERRVALTRQMNATAGFRQFVFRDMDQLATNTAVPAADSSGEDFDSIWSSL